MYKAKTNWWLQKMDEHEESALIAYPIDKYQLLKIDEWNPTDSVLENMKFAIKSLNC